MLEALKSAVGEDHEQYKNILRCYENNCLCLGLKSCQRSRHYELLARVTSVTTCVDPMTDSTRLALKDDISLFFENA